MPEGRFLSGLMLMAWSPRSKDFQEKGLFLGHGTNAIEVAVASSPSRPSRVELAVEHLLDGTLEPALEDHFWRLDGVLRNFKSGSPNDTNQRQA